ncbi:MAG TPA: fumarylacetoacetate hydrolase family protein [Bosea sp. (in: a-proteobacteria)]
MVFENSPHSETDLLADALVRAHLTGTGLDAPSLPVPPSPAGAMQVQALVQQRLARPIGGWKVAIGPQQLPVAAPLLAVYPDDAAIGLSSKFTVEVELAVFLRNDFPRRKAGSYVRSDVLEAIDRVVLGIEVIGGRFENPADVPFLSFLADNLGNRAYVVGDSVPLAALNDIDGLDCDVTLDGRALYRAPASHPAKDPLLPLLAYANAQSDDLGGLKAGQVVTTGSLCGVLPIETAGLLEARVSQVGQVRVRFSD